MARRASSADVSARADAALMRAGRAELAAEIEEERARRAPAALRELHERMAVLHRQAQACHEASAALQLAHADRLVLWEAGLDPWLAGRPVLLACVGDAVGAESAVALRGTTDDPAVIATSGRMARAAMQLELVLEEGPMHDCITHGRALSAPVPAETWPTFGGAAADLGVATVDAHPLAVGGSNLGALITFNAHTTRPDGRPVCLPAVAAAVTEHILGLGTPRAAADDEALGAPGQDVAAVVHCASGMVSQRLGCAPEAALGIIAARALASGEQVEAIARGIIDPPSADETSGPPPTGP